MKTPHKLGYRNQKNSSASAFTLMDLLVTIGVITILFVVILSGTQLHARRSGILECKDNLRRVGVAMDSYRQDHNDQLPGPLFRAAYYTYETNNYISHWAAATFLATYLGGPPPDGTLRRLDVLRCPASVQVVREPSPFDAHFEPVSFELSGYITNYPGDVSTNSVIMDPFGYPYTSAGVSSKPDTQPLTLNRILRPSECWALVDVDQRNTVASPAFGYGAALPKSPVHNNRPGGAPNKGVIRNHLFFDGAVQSVQMDF